MAIQRGSSVGCIRAEEEADDDAAIGVCDIFSDKPFIYTVRNTIGNQMFISDSGLQFHSFILKQTKTRSLRIQ